MTRGISRCGITRSPRPSVPFQLEAYGRRTFRMRSVMLRSLRDPTTARTIEPTVTLTMDSDLWLAIARGEKSGRDAFMNGEYQVSGDLGFMMQFGKIFPVR